MYCDSCPIRVQLKKLIRTGEFLCCHFNIEDEGKYATFSAYYYFKKGKNTTETQKKKKKICAVCGEGAVPEHVKRGL